MVIDEYANAKCGHCWVYPGVKLLAIVGCAMGMSCVGKVSGHSYVCHGESLLGVPLVKSRFF